MNISLPDNLKAIVDEQAASADTAPAASTCGTS